MAAAAAAAARGTGRSTRNSSTATVTTITTTSDTDSGRSSSNMSNRNWTSGLPLTKDRTAGAGVTGDLRRTAGRKSEYSYGGNIDIRTNGL